MMGWILSLLLVLGLGLDSLLPGGMATAIARKVEAQVGAPVVARVTIDADPLLELPFGRIHGVEVGLTGLQVGALPFDVFDLTLAPLHLASGGLLGTAPPVLLAPATVRVHAEVTQEGLQRGLDTYAAAGRFDHMAVDLTFLGRRLAGQVKVSAPKIILQEGRIGLTGLVTCSLPKGSWAVDLSFIPQIIDESKIGITKSRVLLNGKPVPTPLLMGAVGRVESYLQLEKWALPGEAWRLIELEVVNGRLRCRATGQLPAGRLPETAPGPLEGVSRFLNLAE